MSKNTIGKRMLVILERSGKNQYEAADMLGITQPAFNHYLKDKRTPKLSVATKFCEEFGCSLSYLYGLDELEPIGAMKQIPLIGQVEAGAWREACQLPENDWEYINYSVNENYKNKKIFALRVHGNSMNKVFPEGTILICCDIYDYEKEITDGKYVIAEHHKNDLCEATVKSYYRIDKDTVVLKPESTDPRYIDIILREGKEEECQIKAVVISSQTNYDN
jgi:SOS-response transcriptional repressors (RecA-mediated autopeptidases)